MRFKHEKFSNFSRAISSCSPCYRLDNEQQIASLISTRPDNKNFLARGNGLSYSDSCVNDQGMIVDTTRLNHFKSFDPATGIVTCQGHVTFAELFLVHPDFIPPVIPGTVHATLAGGIAHDIHGKNNVHAGTLGQHIEWFELYTNKQILHVSREEHSELFYATIAGMGLTGIIKHIGLKLQKATRHLAVVTEKYRQIEDLLARMQQAAIDYTYMAAWLDLLNKPRAVLFLAQHSDQQLTSPTKQFFIPKLPFRLITKWNMKLFNQFYFHHMQEKTAIQPLLTFNNPLDAVKNWTYLYGKKGLLQFQAVFAAEQAPALIKQILEIIAENNAVPTLAVLKYFTQPGIGLLSFAKPGFTIAIDFINNQQAKNTIKKLNALITATGGKIYLAKDLLLTTKQFNKQYPAQQQFKQILAQYPNNIASNLSRRLGITP